MGQVPPRFGIWMEPPEPSHHRGAAPLPPTAAEGHIMLPTCYRRVNDFVTNRTLLPAPPGGAVAPRSL